MPRGNQYKPLVPLDIIGPWILYYWQQRYDDVKMLVLLREKHIDTSKYGLGLSRLKDYRKEMGLERTRKQGHDVESIRESMERLRMMYPKAGAREMISLLFHEEGKSVSRSVVTAYFAIYEPALVRERKARRLKRKQFWSAGSNDVVAVDQHDKWLRYGLGLHTGVEPFSGKILWIRVWWSNSNPRLILSFYLDVIESQGFMPLVTQSDPGSENYGIAKGHTALRHWHDPSLVGTLQHRWMRSKKNVKPEISWSQLRRRFTPGFEDILQMGIVEDWYDPTDPIEALVFRWVFIPWLQAELDAYKDRVNNSPKRADKNKILPHGRPNHIFDSPEDFGALNFKVGVDSAAVQHVRDLFAPSEHPVFELVPPTFDALAKEIHEGMGKPVITRYNVWDVYLQILAGFHNILDIPPEYEADWQTALMIAENDKTRGRIPPDLNLDNNLQELANGMEVVREDGSYYMGGVNNGEGLNDEQQAQLARMLDEDEPEVSRIEGEELVVDFSSDEGEAGDDW